MFGAIIQILISGFVIGALARFAVPGPDPMPIWLTIMIGIVGAIIGGGIAGAIFGTEQDSGSVFAILIGSIVASIVLLVLYRRYVQHRPITGPDAQRPPRDRPHLGTLLGAPGQQVPQQADVSDQLRKLDEAHRQGILTDEEFEAKKAALLARH
jgi:uncharacterized membrane protein YeaQ/YmgE (transglycosylase-associated protein family)